MRLLRSSALTLGLATAGTVVDAQPQFLINELSFGYNGLINPRGGDTVPGYSLSGTPDPPELLSNKVILTPLAPGNTRGAVWAETPNEYVRWVTDLDFRTNGPERGGGNLNVWLAKGGGQAVGQSSIYTVGQFEGLALVVDQHGGSGGMIRGFLNDGTTDFSTHHSVDSLAFGHCTYPYRNLGRPSQLKLRQTDAVFKVEIDGRLCFETDKISIPPGYHFGITAAAAENPDSFEVFKMVVMTDDLQAKGQAPPPWQQEDQQQQRLQQNQQQNQQQQNPEEVVESKMRYFGRQRESFPPPDEQAQAQQGGQDNGAAASAAAAADAIRDVQERLNSLSGAAAGRHGDVMQALRGLTEGLGRLSGLPERVAALEAELARAQRELKDARADVKARVRDSEHAIKGFMGDKHGSMLEHVAVQAAEGPRHGRVILVVVLSQAVLVLGYVWYERKKTSPKKYL